jgi:hypothetical protein
MQGQMQKFSDEDFIGILEPVAAKCHDESVTMQDIERLRSIKQNINDNYQHENRERLLLIINTLIREALGIVEGQQKQEEEEEEAALAQVAVAQGKGKEDELTWLTTLGEMINTNSFWTTYNVNQQLFITTLTALNEMLKHTDPEIKQKAYEISRLIITKVNGHIEWMADKKNPRTEEYEIYLGYAKKIQELPVYSELVSLHHELKEEEDAGQAIMVERLTGLPDVPAGMAAAAPEPAPAPASAPASASAPAPAPTPKKKPLQLKGFEIENTDKSMSKIIENAKKHPVGATLREKYLEYMFKDTATLIHLLGTFGNLFRSQDNRCTKYLYTLKKDGSGGHDPGPVPAVFGISTPEDVQALLVRARGPQAPNDLIAMKADHRAKMRLRGGSKKRRRTKRRTKRRRTKKRRTKRRRTKRRRTKRRN